MFSQCDRKQRSKHDTKQTNLVSALRRDRFGACSDDYDTIINLAGITLSQLQKDVLCGGQDFGIPPKFNQTDILAEFELLQQQLSTVPAKSDMAAATCRGIPACPVSARYTIL